MKRPLLSSVVGVLLFALHAPVQASVVSVSFTGQVWDVHSPLDSQFSIGDLVTLNFAYETTVVDTNGDPIYGQYAAITSASGTIGSYAFSSGPGAIFVSNYSLAPFGDHLAAEAPAIAASVAGLLPTHWNIGLNDFAGLALSNDAMPTLLTWGLLSGFHGFSLNFPGGLSVRADISQTPLPPALLLFLTGLGVMGLVARRKTRAAPART